MSKPVIIHFSGRDPGDKVKAIIKNLADDNESLREALRIKEANCEAWVGDWRRVRDVMPPIGCPVLAIGGVLDEARIISRESDGNFDLWCWLNGDICEWDNCEQPTHWMPLPEPPEREKL